ncbi:MAG: tRNA (N(6)-L-threonylcarbamoyladenosine(37)-C(2))-methylthiotransferase MtaB [Anaerolineales bacterium]|nr:tRNA (N(6)-L-threonylcarbamoyladenosine(37)-C(2))-methylthiotransferase MtaB [Anaerolineales bacterium]
MKIYLDTIGCRLNQAEIETMARQFRAAGHEIVATADQADLAVINTCTVTSQAASDSRGKIRAAARRGAGEIAVTGCWATLEPQSAAALPGVSRVVPNLRKDFLVADVLDLQPSTFDPSRTSGRRLEPLPREPLPGLHQRTRSFIKVQDGCDNHCTYCITAIARGAARSQPIPDVLADVRAALAGGTKEVVLTGVHLGSWGQDLNLHLRDLLATILKETDTPRLRLSSLEPWDLDADFFTLWQDARLCRHLHLPLQSGSAGVLRRMARKTTPEAYAALLAAARAAIPDVAITTDVIAGFPGETEAEFTETLDFVRQMNFSGGHVFTYSARPGTAAARMGGQIPHEVRKERNAVLRAAFAESERTYQQKFLGKIMSVLWESTDQLNDAGWQMEGLTDNYLRVTAVTPGARWNQIDSVKLVALAGEPGDSHLQGDCHLE